MLETASRPLGEMIVNSKSSYKEDQLYGMIPVDLATFEWYRQQMLVRGEGVEAHLVHAGHELANLISQILDTAMTQRGVVNGDMFGRLRLLREEILEAIDD